MAQRLGEMYTIGDGVDRDGDEALRWFMLAATKGCLRPTTASPQCHNRGFGARCSRTEAIRWYRRAAAAGWQESLSHAGALH